MTVKELLNLIPGEFTAWLNDTRGRCITHDIVPYINECYHNLKVNRFYPEFKESIYQNTIVIETNYRRQING